MRDGLKLVIRLITCAIVCFDPLRPSDQDIDMGWGAAGPHGIL